MVNDICGNEREEMVQSRGGRATWQAASNIDMSTQKRASGTLHAT